MKRKYGPIQVDDECVDQMVNAVNLRTAQTWGDIGTTNSGAQKDG